MGVRRFHVAHGWKVGGGVRVCICVRPSNQTHRLGNKKRAQGRGRNEKRCCETILRARPTIPISVSGQPLSLLTQMESNYVILEHQDV